METSTTPFPLSARPEVTFDFSSSPAVHHRGNAYLSHFWNALSIMAPSTERAAMRVLRNARKSIDDPRLRADIDAFLKQEGLHTREHRRFNARLAALGYEADAAVARADRALDAYLDRVDPAAGLALVIAGEHLIYALARDLLDDPRVLEGMDLEVKRLFQWHALEEVEHQSVAHDVYVHLHGDGPKHRLVRAKALKDAASILGTTIRDILGGLMAAEPHRGRREQLDLARFMLLRPGYGRSVLGHTLRFLAPGFNPWEKPEDVPLIEDARELLSVA
ncbi:MAG: metal-dependent hydrolase [Polyangiales bacterium]|jgi:predicted metal-dependent hydrolase